MRTRVSTKTTGEQDGCRGEEAEGKNGEVWLAWVGCGTREPSITSRPVFVPLAINVAFEKKLLSSIGLSIPRAHRTPRVSSFSERRRTLPARRSFAVPSILFFFLRGRGKCFQRVRESCREEKEGKEKKGWKDGRERARGEAASAAASKWNDRFAAVDSRSCSARRWLFTFAIS